MTRQNIDALNCRLKEFQHPPSIYVTEYEELTCKLAELESKKQKLTELLASTMTVSVADESQASNKAQPRTLQAHLPNQQRTRVQVREGLSLRDALAKAMKLRNLKTEMCVVHMIQDSETKLFIPWDTDISTLEYDEISVEILDKFPIPTSISHNFVRKTFFSLAFCECCRKLLFQVR